MAQNYKGFLNLEEGLSKIDEDEALIFKLCAVSVIQDPFNYLCQKRSRALAKRLIDSDGKVVTQKFHIPSLPADPIAGEILLYQHQQKFLRRWFEEKNFAASFKRFQLPLCHAGAESIVRDTLLLNPLQTLTSAHVMEAVLCACLTLLRQNVGSCFATAPAIVIHEEQQDRLIEDLLDLLMRGRLTRVVGGTEYAVPLSLSWGSGSLKRSLFEGQIWNCPGLILALEAVNILDPNLPWKEKPKGLYQRLYPFLQQKKGITVESFLQAIVPPPFQEEAKRIFKSFADNALLKSWEFSLASLSESKADFSRWNLYQSLGFHPSVTGGIGELLYREIDQKLQENNQKTTELHDHYQIAHDQMRIAESQLRNASTESEARRLRSEYQARAYNLQTCQEMFEKSQLLSQSLSSLFSFLIQQYDSKLSTFFQEIYDPDMGEFSKGSLYADSPAGFRLVYKHGRGNSNLWTPIFEKETFVKAIVEFFNYTESDITQACKSEVEKKIVSSLTTAILLHLRSEQFITAVLERLGKQNKSPWSYVSGGTMDTLLKTYYCKDYTLTIESRLAENGLDLANFILDVLKTFSKPPIRILIQSPTHAFSLLPYLELFHEGWQDRGFTYTWIRDHILVPGKAFYDRFLLSAEEQKALQEKLSLSLETTPHCTLSAFKDRLSKAGVNTPDAFLYSALPLTARAQCQAVLHALLKPWNLDPAPSFTLPNYLTAQELLELAKKIVLDSGLKEKNLEDLLLKQARLLQLVPKPLLFADTNWINQYFGFVVGPSSGELELWCLDPLGSKGFPMNRYENWFDPQNKAPWIIYSKPSEYGM